MTIEEKKEALCDAVSTAWDDAFCDWELEESKENPKIWILGEKTPQNGFIFFLAGCRDLYGGWIWIEYEPEEDIVGIYIKDRPIQEKFKEDLKTLFEKYSPFHMTLSYERENIPVIFRKEKVKPEDFLTHFKAFRKAYDEYNSLFYMFTVCAKEWYDGFCIQGSDC